MTTWRLGCVEVTFKGEMCGISLPHLDFEGFHHQCRRNQSLRLILNTLLQNRRGASHKVAFCALSNSMQLSYYIIYIEIQHKSFIFFARYLSCGLCVQLHFHADWASQLGKVQVNLLVQQRQANLAQARRSYGPMAGMLSHTEFQCRIFQHFFLDAIF